MIYLDHFEIPDRSREESFNWDLQSNYTCFDTIYPFFTLTGNGLKMFDFEDITILYGGNGSGKTTALNVIAEKIGAKRDTLFNKSNFFSDYIDMCSYNMVNRSFDTARIITSDDVFDFMMNLRMYNEDIDTARDELLEGYYKLKNREFQLKSLDDIDLLRQKNLQRRKSKSQYIRGMLSDNVREHSNGESAFIYFTEKIKDNSLYLLDEPENSLSPERQIELVKFLSDSARFFGCQFIIATHSPFILSLRGAKIYDLDECPVDVKRWTELSNVRAYYDFFREHKNEFY